MKTHAALFSYIFQNETKHNAFLLNIRFMSLQNKYILKIYLREQMAQVFLLRQ